MTNKAKPAAAGKEKPAAKAPAPDAETSGTQTEKLVEVVAAKAFLDPTGWVQPGQKVSVTPGRKRDLARNGLIEGADASSTAPPLGSGPDRKQKLHVTASTGENKDNS